MDTVQRINASTLRFQATDLSENPPSSKISINGDPPFSGTWEIKAWDGAHHRFDLIVADEEISAKANSTPSAILNSDGKKINWTKDTPFTSVPQSMWWCITTLTTVGYGDMYPVTVCGRLIAAATMMCGLVLFGMLMNIIGKAMMVALFGSDQGDDTIAPAPTIAAPKGGLAWDPHWRHCPTCGHLALANAVSSSGPTPCAAQELAERSGAELPVLQS